MNALHFSVWEKELGPKTFEHHKTRWMLWELQYDL
jgi:hypothetical protein